MQDTLWYCTECKIHTKHEVTKVSDKLVWSCMECGRTDTARPFTDEEGLKLFWAKVAETGGPEVLENLPNKGIRDVNGQFLGFFETPNRYPYYEISGEKHHYQIGRAHV